MSASSTPIPLGCLLARWDDLSDRWGLGSDQRGALLGSPAAGPLSDVRTYQAELAERRMRLLVELDATLQQVFGDDERSREWLRAGNRRLGGDSPLTVMATSSAWTRWLIKHLDLTA